MKSLALKIYCSLLCLVFSFCEIKAQDYNDIWKNINKNERNTATQTIALKIKNNNASIDEFITYNFLKSFDGKEDEIKNFSEVIAKSDNPYPYIYALWFTPPVAGEYGRKEPHQLTLLNKLITDKPGNGTLRASAHYSLGHHYIRIHQFDKVKVENEKMKALCDWQFVGPFNNVSGSGFNKNYPPVKDPSNASVFTSLNNAPIKWFTPIVKSTEGWMLTKYFISENTRNITFAQTFVKSEAEQDVILCTGFAGNIKVWVNDQLIISVPVEKVTEMDAYNIKCHLNAGYNRILIQLGSDNVSPNFIVRLTDTNYNGIENISSIATPQPYTKNGGESLNSNIPIFAESYFIEKIKAEPANIVNYMLLNRVYLRNKKVFEARKTIEQALALAPDNSMLKFELLMCYSKENNRTGITELFEYFKDHENQSLISYLLRIDDLKDQGKYQEVLDLIDEKTKLYGSDETSYDDRIQMLSKLNAVPKLIALVNEAYQKYPDYDRFVNYTFNIEKNVNKDPRKALKILEKYMQSHYDYGLNQLLISEYFNNHDSKKPYQVLQNCIETFPFDPDLRIDLVKQYTDQQRYAEAYDVCNYILKMSPYDGYNYQLKATVEQALNKTDDAIKSYQTAFTFRPTLYESRAKQRKLQNKKSLFEAVTPLKIDDLVSNTGKNIKTEDYDFYYLLDDNQVVIYPEGGREEIHAMSIKVLNQRGLDRFKQFSLPYNGNSETIIIEESQLIKPNGKKLKPETNDNQLVWTGLEANDIIYFRYKIRSYNVGKFAREFYDKFVFDGFVPVENARYCLITPANRKFNYKVINGDVPFNVTDFEDYKIYLWEKKVNTAIDEEPFMPPSADFATTLHISTLDEWNDIAQWYSDLVYSKIASDNDYEILEVYKSLFNEKKNLSAEQKARIIYNYIEKNISYSSVSFRQSAIIPQKASTTIITRLGDCKDISTLFVSLANLCGLKSNMVLVSTRDNGIKDMFLPSFLFNHCIVKYFDEKNAEHYLELTDRDLPFKSLPSDLFQAMSLTIPSKDDTVSKYSLVPINSLYKTIDKSIVNSKVKITGNDMEITTASVKYGNLTSGVRQTFSSLSKENTIKKVQENMSGQFTNPVTVNDVSFQALDEYLDSISMRVNMNISKEVKKIGAHYAFTIPFADVIFTSAPFNLAKRKQDFEYWDYENSDEYETRIEIALSDEKVFEEIPTGQKFSYKQNTYSISYSRTAPGKIVVLRKVHMQRNNITPADYPEFKSYVLKIIDAEGAYLTFK